MPAKFRSRYGRDSIDLSTEREQGDVESAPPRATGAAAAGATDNVTGGANGPTNTPGPSP